jgi:DNA-binding MarR family transcriptional regulator
MQPISQYDQIADRLHSAAIHLLRRLRRVDPAMGLAPAAASALSVIVFGGPRTLGQLAAAEQIRPPSLTPLVRALEAAGLARRERDVQDRRVVRIAATEKGRRLLQQGRSRRVGVLSGWLKNLNAADFHALKHGVDVLDRLVR